MDLIWEEVYRIFQESILVEVEHVNAHRSKREMGLLREVEHAEACRSRQEKHEMTLSKR